MGKLRLIISLTVPSLFLMIILFPFTELSPYLPVPHTLKISALNEKSPSSKSSDVKLLEIKVDGKTVPLKSLEQSGNWSMENGALRNHGQAMLTYVFTIGWDSKVEVLFEKDPSAGLVKIEYDDLEPVVKDLYYAGSGNAGFSSQPSPFSNRTSFIFVALLFIVEFIVTFGFVSFISTYYSQLGMYVSVILFLGLTLTFYQFQTNIGFRKINGGWQFFTGKEGVIKAYGPVYSYGTGSGDRSDALYCLEILNAVPGPAQVLNLNGFGAIEPCLFSPLLPQDKIVHHYESITNTGPYYRDLMFGEPQTAYKLYRQLGINYFYVRKNDWYFVNLGYSRALEPQNLEQYFDVFAETDDFYILTWRGEGLYPVSSQLAQEISTWYDRSKDGRYNALRFWWQGREELEDWVKMLP